MRLPWRQSASLSPSPPARRWPAPASTLRHRSRPAIARRATQPAGWAPTSSTLDLRLTRFSELWIRAVPEEDVGALGVVEHAAQAIPVPRRGKPRRDAGLAHRVHVGALFDQ